MTEASVCCVAAPRQERLPPHTLRVTTAGRMACSARQLVTSMAGLRRKLNSADVDRPEDQYIQWLDLTYLNEATADPIDLSRTAAGRRIRALMGPDPIARQSKLRRAHPTTTRRGTVSIPRQSRGL